MDTALLLTVLDKYGPMAAALIVVSLVLICFVWKILPMVVEMGGKRLDAIVDAFKQAGVSVNDKLDTHEANDAQRHDKIMGKLDLIDGKLLPGKEKI